MAFKFPFTNYHELNLTWVLEQLKKLFEESTENVETIENYENRLSAVETELPVVEATADQAATTANAAATLAQTAKATADTANENALTASTQAGLARNEAAAADVAAQAATQAAQQAQATAQDFDGRITQAEDDASEALQEAQSFNNRVNAAINTANNAANTATIAQGIAVNANQNAATALDTAQAADTKAEAAQNAAEVADGKAEAAQDAAEVADGKAEAAQDAAEIADGKAETNADSIGNLSDLTTIAKNNLVAAINEAAQTGGEGGLQTDLTLYVSSSPTAFNESNVYSVRALVSYDGHVWECHTAVTEPGPWTGETNWTEEGLVSDNNNSGLASNDPITIEKALTLIPKNLNTHTVTLNFISSVYRGSSANLEFSNFKNGILIINGNNFGIYYYGQRLRGVSIINCADVYINNLVIRTTYRGSGLRIYRSTVYINGLTSYGGTSWEDPYNGVGLCVSNSTIYLAGDVFCRGSTGIYVNGSIVSRQGNTNAQGGALALTLLLYASSNNIINNSGGLIMLGSVITLYSGSKSTITTSNGGITNASIVS